MTEKETFDRIIGAAEGWIYRESMGEPEDEKALEIVTTMYQELKERRVVMPALAKHEKELLAELEKYEWVRTSERVPDGERTVLVLGDDMDTIDLKDASELREDEVSRIEWPYWLPLPPLPEVEK